MEQVVVARQWIPEAKVYGKTYSRSTCGDYARLIAFHNFKKVCSVTNCKNKRIDVHHKNKNFRDNRLNNLEVICSYHHHKLRHPPSEEVLTMLRTAMLGKTHSNHTKKQMRISALENWKNITKSKKKARIKKLSETRRRKFQTGEIIHWNLGRLSTIPRNPDTGRFLKKERGDAKLY